MQNACKDYKLLCKFKETWAILMSLTELLKESWFTQNPEMFHKLGPGFSLVQRHKG